MTKSHRRSSRSSSSHGSSSGRHSRKDSDGIAPKPAIDTAAGPVKDKSAILPVGTTPGMVVDNPEAVLQSEKQPPPGEDERDENFIAEEVGAGLGLNIQEAPEVPPKMSNLIRILSYGTRMDYALMIVGSIAAIGTGATMPLMNVVFGNLSGSFTTQYSPGNTSISPAEIKAIQDQFKRDINHQTLWLVYLFIARFVLSYITQFCFRVTGLRISAALRLAYLRALFDQPLAVFDALPVGAVATRITASANTIQLGISAKLSRFLTFLSLLISAFAVSFTKNWVLTFVTCIIFPILIIAYGLSIPVTLKINKRIEEIDDRASSLAGEIFGSIRTVVAFGAESKLGKQYSDLVNRSRKEGLKLAPLTGAQMAPIFFGIYCAFSITFWYGVRQYSRHEISSVSSVITVLFSVMLAVMSLGNVIDPLSAMSKAAAASTALFQTIDAPRPKLDGLKDPDVSPHEDITFQGVDFYYPSRPNVKVLDNLNLTFPANKITAIVGPSGSGKSTIVGLLERWYTLNESDVLSNFKITIEKQDDQDPTKIEEVELKYSNKGSVFVGQHNILDLDLRWWRQQIGMVQQEPFLFNDTILKNVAYGLIGTEHENASDEEKLELTKIACEEAFASEFIDRLPEGYDTKVGESGIKLSGGQRQRLAIARSIVSRPQILILDEATSAIDVRSERIVQAALDKVSQNRTTIVIAHRLSTIKKADKIIVLQKGKAVEEGTHESLLQIERGVYHGLVNAQTLTMQNTEDHVSETSTEEDLEISKANLVKTESVKLKLTKTKSKDVEASGYVREEDGYKRKSTPKAITALLYEQRKRWPWYVFMLFAAVLAGGAYPAQAVIFSEVISAFTVTAAAAPKIGNFWALMFFVLACGIGVVYYVLGHSSGILSFKIASAYRKEYFRTITHKRIAFFDGDDNSPGTLIARVQTDPNQIKDLLSTNSAMLLVALVNVVAGAILGFAIGWKLSLVAFFVAMPFAYGAGFLYIKHETKYEKMNNEVFAESAQFATEAVGAFRTVSALTLEALICDRYELLLKNHATEAFKTSRWSGLIFAFSDSVTMLSMALTFWYGSRLLADGVYSVKKFFIIYIGIVQSGEAAGQFSAFAPNIAQATAAANRIFSIRGTDKERKEKEGKIILKKSDKAIGIEFRNVKFQYPTRKLPVYSDLSLKIKPGQFAALVGPSGCGKTTVVSLIERFYDIQSGKILFDGVDVSELDISSLRSSMSLVAQEPVLYQGTIRENILLGVDKETTSDAEIVEACKAAEMHTFINSLPDGYNTQVGSKGVSLSGGQKQRIAIARALIRKPRILLLDEATSSLDGPSERLIQTAFERAAKGRTMVVVAHRLATIQKADVIFVFGDGGQLVEFGSHQELLSKRGAYWSMCESQALDR